MPVPFTIPPVGVTYFCSKRSSSSSFEHSEKAGEGQRRRARVREGGRGSEKAGEGQRRRARVRKGGRGSEKARGGAKRREEARGGARRREIVRDCASYQEITHLGAHDTLCLLEHQLKPSMGLPPVRLEYLGALGLLLGRAPSKLFLHMLPGLHHHTHARCTHTRCTRAHSEN